MKTPVKEFLIFDEDFEIGRIQNRTYRAQAVLKNFNPGSMTGATIHLHVQLDPEETGWGPMGTDEFVIGVWANDTVGDPDVEVVMHNKEYIKHNQAPVSLRAGDNYFYLEVNHGRTSELGKAKGHVKVWVEVQYSDPNNPPEGIEPVDIFTKIKNWIEEHPIETAVLGLGAMFVYTSGKKKRRTKKTTKTEEETEVQNIIVIPGGAYPIQPGQGGQVIYPGYVPPKPPEKTEKTETGGEK